MAHDSVSVVWPVWQVDVVVAHGGYIFLRGSWVTPKLPFPVIMIAPGGCYNIFNCSQNLYRQPREVGRFLSNAHVLAKWGALFSPT